MTGTGHAPASSAGLALPGEGQSYVGPQPAPLHPDAVTRAWMASFMAGNGYPGLADVALCEPLEGTATKLRLALSWKPGFAGPGRVMMKGGFSEHRERMAYLYAHEARFFREVAPGLDVTVPTCFGTAEDPGTGQYLVVMEDLDLVGARFCRVEQPFDLETAKAFLDMLARLHAAYWGSDVFEPAGPFESLNHWEALPSGARGNYQRGQLEETRFRQYLDLPRGRALPQIFHDHRRMTLALERVTEFGRARPWSLVHGDFHIGNLYQTADGRPGALDWQTWSRGHWAHDVTYFLVSALDMLDRRRWVDELMGFYLQSLAAHGVARPPSRAEAMEAFRIHLVYGLFFWLVNPVAFQSEANNASVAPRFALAAVDHGLFDDL